MLLVYFSSVTENTARFVQKLDLPSVRIPVKGSEPLEVSEPFVLVTPTYGAGSKGFVPKQVVKFLNHEPNRVRCKGVIGSGNRNFFEDYCKAASIISAKLEIPVLYRFELAGTSEDIENVVKGMNTFGRS